MAAAPGGDLASLITYTPAVFTPASLDVSNLLLALGGLKADAASLASSVGGKASASALDALRATVVEHAALLEAIKRMLDAAPAGGAGAGAGGAPLSQILDLEAAVARHAHVVDRPFYSDVCGARALCAPRGTECREGRCIRSRSTSAARGAAPGAGARRTRPRARAARGRSAQWGAGGPCGGLLPARAVTPPPRRARGAGGGSRRAVRAARS